MPPSPPTASPYSRVRPNWCSVDYELIHKNQSELKRITNLRKKVSHFTLKVDDWWFPISGIRPSPDFFHPDSAQPFGVKWSKFSQEPRTATELEMETVSCCLPHLISPPPCVCRPFLLSWLFKGWLWIIPPGYETNECVVLAIAIEQGGRALGEVGVGLF